MKFYKATKSSVTPSIVEIEVERETDKCVWINGRKCNKSSDYECYEKTWEDARATLVVYFNDKLQAAKRSVEYAEKIYKKAASIPKTQPK